MLHCVAWQQRKNQNLNPQLARKAAATTKSSARAKKATSKRSQSAAKLKKTQTGTRHQSSLKKREELTLKMFQMVYEAYQQGRFHRIM